MLVTLPRKYKPFVLPVLTFAVVVVLSSTLGKFLLEKIFEARSQITSLESQNRLLEAKQQLLSSFSDEEVKRQTGAVSLAVPSESPSIPLLSLVRTLANENAVVISDFRVEESQEAKKTARQVQASFSGQGSIFSIISFLRSVGDSVPLTKVSGIKFTVSGINIDAKLTVVSSWAPVPQELGKVENPIEGISSAEKELLGKLSGLKKPQIFVSSGGSEPAGKPDPFSF